MDAPMGGGLPFAPPQTEPQEQAAWYHRQLASYLQQQEQQQQQQQQQQASSYPSQVSEQLTNVLRAHAYSQSQPPLPPSQQLPHSSSSSSSWASAAIPTATVAAESTPSPAGFQFRHFGAALNSPQLASPLASPLTSPLTSPALIAPIHFPHHFPPAQPSRLPAPFATGAQTQASSYPLPPGVFHAAGGDGQGAGGSGNPSAAKRLKIAVDEIALTPEEKQGFERFSEEAIQSGAERYIEAEDQLVELDDEYDSRASSAKQTMKNNALFIKMYLRKCLNNNTTLANGKDQEVLTVRSNLKRLRRDHILTCTSNTLLRIKCQKCVQRSQAAIKEAARAINAGEKTEADFPAAQWPEIFDKNYVFAFVPPTALGASIEIANVIEAKQGIENKLVVVRVRADGKTKRQPMLRDNEIQMVMPPERL